MRELAPGQRYLVVWALVTATLAFLVIYLDGGLDREPLPFFTFLWLLDALWLVVVFIRYRGRYRYQWTRSLPLPHNMKSLGPWWALFYAVTVVLKAGFQVLFCIRLRHPDSAIALGLFAMMAPLWAALLFTIGALFVQLVHQHIELGSVLEE